MPTENKNNRVRNYLVFVFVAILGWKILAPMITEPLAKKRDAINSELQNIDNQQNRLAIVGRYSESVRDFGRKSLPKDVTTATLRYQDWLRSHCERVGIENPILTFREPTKMAGLGNKLQLSLKTNSSLVAVGDLIDLMSVAPIAHRIASLKLRDWDATSNRIQLEMEIDAIAVDENPTFDSALLTRVVEPRGLGKFLSEQRNFERFQSKRPPIETLINQPTKVELEPEPIPIPSAPKVDVLGSYRLVGIIEKDGTSRALFRNGITGVDTIIDESRELRVDQFIATVERITSENVLLKQGFREIYISLGQTLRQGLIEAVKIH